ncbi:hypothetical protein HDU67_007890 [Dinochytrium kinnereticum]|nr:hypothetical protein HDU67_007890 [Dinochytrium kinnereticum]
MSLQPLTVTCHACGIQWRQSFSGHGEGMCTSCLRSLLQLKNGFQGHHILPANLELLLTSFADLPPLPIISNILKTPSTTNLDDDDNAAASSWIDRAIIEKFYRSGRYLPFEVVRRRTLMEGFDGVGMILR